TGEFMKPENFYVTNPNLGLSVSSDWIERELTKELASGPETRNVFLAKHLNVEIGSNLRANRWPGAEFWAERTDKTITSLDALLDRCEVCVVGIDGGGLDDLFGMTIVGREKGSWNWLSWSHAWCHTSVLERRKAI